MYAVWQLANTINQCAYMLADTVPIEWLGCIIGACTPAIVKLCTWSQHLLTPALCRTLSQMKRIARAMYSNPPVHGARIVAEVVNNGAMFDEWKSEMESMSGRIKSVRKMLFDEISALYPEKDWSSILSQIGMFSYTGRSHVGACVWRTRLTWSGVALSARNFRIVLDPNLPIFGCRHDSRAS
jgi:hypothetical protein